MKSSQVLGVFAELTEEISSITTASLTHLDMMKDEATEVAVIFHQGYLAAIKDIADCITRAHEKLEKLAEG